VNEVIYLSAPAPVHMADEWFGIASQEHFWIKRRFEVLRKLARGFGFHGQTVGEIGCGHGMIQKQFEEHYGLKVDGFDLNTEALRSSIATNHRRYCYNVFDCNPQFATRYDVLVLFDVLEHIEDEGPFLDAVLFHLKAGGYLLLNVPAFMSLHSRYDEVVGHQRRYSLAMLEAVCVQAGLKRIACTYWGLPYVPLLLLRKWWVMREQDPQQVTRRGYQPPGRLVNRLLSVGGRLEPIPQLWLGSSLMAIYRK
jgi:SAM-dependent methyltransferase